MTTVAALLDYVRTVRATEAEGSMRMACLSAAPLRAAMLANFARRTRPVSRSAVLAASNMVRQCAHADRGEMLSTIWSHGPSRAAWSTAFMLAWLGGSGMVVEAARTRARLTRWLDYARLWEPLPFVRPHVVAREEMTETVTLYRGGLAGAAEPLGGGYSWTGRPEVAALYGALRALEFGGAPVVVQAEVPREAIKMRTRTRDDEAVITEPVEGAEVYLDNEQEIERLAALEAAGRGDLAEGEIIHLDMHDDRCWHGWSHG